MHGDVHGTFEGGITNITPNLYILYNHPLEDNQATWCKKFPCEYLYKR